MLGAPLLGLLSDRLRASAAGGFTSARFNCFFTVATRVQP